MYLTESMVHSRKAKMQKGKSTDMQNTQKMQTDQSPLEENISCIYCFLDMTSEFLTGYGGRKGDMNDVRTKNVRAVTAFFQNLLQFSEHLPGWAKKITLNIPVV